MTDYGLEDKEGIVTCAVRNCPNEVKDYGYTCEECLMSAAENFIDSQKEEN